MNLKIQNIQKPLATLLIVGVLLPSFIFFAVPKKASAELPDVCQILSNAILGKAADVVKSKAEDEAKNAAEDAAKSATSVPVHDSAANTTLKNIKGNTDTTAEKTTNQWATTICKEVLTGIARTLLDKMTRATIDWINNDFHGKPLFVENPKSFFTDIRKTEVRSFVDLVGYDSLKFPFGKQIALNVIDSYNSQLANNAEYSLSKVINDPILLANYRNEFSFGGWNGFLINTQYPQNNPIGFNLEATNYLASKIDGTTSSVANTVKDTLQQGLGFLSPQTCPSNPNYPAATNPYNPPTFQYDAPYNPPYPDVDEDDTTTPEGIANLNYDNEWKADKAKAQADFNTKYNCTGGLVNTTPGSVVASQITTALGSTFRQSELAAALGNDLAATFDALLNHFLDKGLNALSDKINPPTPPDPELKYNDDTLALPQNVTIEPGDSTDISISRGTAPYSVKTRPDERVAVVTVSGKSINIAGVAAGNTFVVIQDSSVPAKSAAIQIMVNSTVDTGTPTPTPASAATNPQINSVMYGASSYITDQGKQQQFILDGSGFLQTGVQTWGKIYFYKGDVLSDTQSYYPQMVDENEIRVSYDVSTLSPDITSLSWQIFLVPEGSDVNPTPIAASNVVSISRGPEN